MPFGARWTPGAITKSASFQKRATNGQLTGQPAIAPGFSRQLRAQSTASSRWRCRFAADLDLTCHRLTWLEPSFQFGWPRYHPCTAWGDETGGD